MFPLAHFLRQELRDAPGRASYTLRLTLSCAVLITLFMTLQIPFLAVALIVVFYVSQPNVLMIKLVSVVFFVTVTVALGGVLLINLSGGGLGGGFTLLGDGAVLLAALANGFSISLFKRYAEGEDTLTLCGYQFIVGGGAFAADGTVLRRYAAAFHRAVPSAVGIHGAAVRRGPDHLERPDPV